MSGPDPRVARVNLFIHLAGVARKSEQHEDVVQDLIRKALDLIEAYPGNWDAEMEKIDKLNPQ